MNVAALNDASEAERREVFARCCGSTAWVAAMVAAAPFADDAGVHDAADRAFSALTEDDWLEAFAHHPRIGDVSRLRERFAQSGVLSEKEQGTALASANDDVIAELFAHNQAYEARHGHIFIVFASGKSASEMLDLLRQRIHLEHATELVNCAAEQAKITHRRLDGLP